MSGKKYKWYKIADTASALVFNSNNLLEIEVEGKKICLIKTMDGFSACQLNCPHAGASLAEGCLKDGNIVCPVHGYIFSLKNGRDILGEGYFLKIYPVKQDTPGIFLGIEEGGFLKWWK